MTETRMTAFISSTAIDLPQHRKLVIQACTETGYFPDGMEHWPAADANALQLCLDQVDKADVFIGVYGHRYGWVPPGQTLSITELEYQHAVERDIPRLLFVMDEQHPVLAGDVETGSGAEALKVFKQRISSERVRATFDNADKLRAEVLHALGALKPATVNAPGMSSTLSNQTPSNISPSPAHFVGRQREMEQLQRLLTADGTGAAPSGGRGMIVATFSPGGLGKTAFARHYAHHHAAAYAAGGTWELGCEGVKQLGAALLRLADEPRFVQMGQSLQPPVLLSLSQAQKQDDGLAAKAVLAYLESVVQARAAALRPQKARNTQRRGAEPLPTGDQPRALLLLDNVDQTELLCSHQTALLPSAPWLELLVTTRLSPQDFHLQQAGFRSMEISVLPEADALQLMRDFQPGQCFANAPEEAAASAIVRALGGYTLAVELVAAYLGDMAHQQYQPSHYLEQLKQAGLTSVDQLAHESAVQAQIRHRQDVAQNHIATLIGWSLARLSPSARSALEFASLLMPDEIPLAWLQALTQARHPTALAQGANAPAPWPAVWQALHGLRLLHPVGNPQYDARGIAQMPTTVRLHRLVASHVAAANTEAAQCFAGLDQFFEASGRQFEQQVGQGNDAELIAQHPWLRDQLSHLIDSTAPPPTPSLLRSAAVAANFEGQHGSLVRALELTQRILRAKEAYLAANPLSEDAARDVSTSLLRLGDLIAQRGQRGDAELALGYFERSLKISEELLAANPLSAQAARDVSVSLDKLGDFLAQRGQSGDAGQALEYFERNLKTHEQLQAINPQSARAAREVSMSLDRLGAFLAQRDQSGDIELSLGYFQRSLKIKEKLLAANPQSAQAARDLSVSLGTQGHFLALRDQSGDAAQALGYLERCLQIGEALLAADRQSAQAARDVSVSLEKLGDLLSQRGQSGDAERALEYSQRSLEIKEGLLAANPQSAQVARDVCVSLNQLGNFLAQRGQRGDAEQALEYFERSLKISETLLAANPQSAQTARDMLLSHLQLADFHAKAGDAQSENSHLSQCFAILDTFAKEDRPMDATMRELYAHLKPMFAPEQ